MARLSPYYGEYQFLRPACSARSSALERQRRWRAGSSTTRRAACSPPSARATRLPPPWFGRSRERCAATAACSSGCGAAPRCAAAWRRCGGSPSRRARGGCRRPPRGQKRLRRPKVAAGRRPHGQRDERVGLSAGTAGPTGPACCRCASRREVGLPERRWWAGPAGGAAEAGPGPAVPGGGFAVLGGVGAAQVSQIPRWKATAETQRETRAAEDNRLGHLSRHLIRSPEGTRPPVAHAGRTRKLVSAALCATLRLCGCLLSAALGSESPSARCTGDPYDRRLACPGTAAPLGRPAVGAHRGGEWPPERRWWADQLGLLRPGQWPAVPGGGQGGAVGGESAAQPFSGSARPGSAAPIS